MSDQTPAGDNQPAAVNPFAGVTPLPSDHVKDSGGQIAAMEGKLPPQEPDPQEPPEGEEEEAGKVENPEEKEAVNPEEGEQKEAPEGEEEAETKTEDEEEEKPESPTLEDFNKLQESYDNLRTAYNRRDDEIREARESRENSETKVKEVEAKFQEQLKESQTAKDQLQAWYDKYAPVFQEAAKDPVIADKLQKIYKGHQQPLTESQVAELARKQFEDLQRQQQEDREIDDFIKENGEHLANEAIANEFKDRIDKIGSIPDKKTMEVILKGVVAEKTKVAKKDSEAEQTQKQQAKADAQVGGTSPNQAKPPKNELDGLFEQPPGRFPIGGLFG